MHTPHSTPPAAAHQFKGLNDWIEVFKAGAHTDSKGRACRFAESDLDQMVSNLALGAVPAVLGHPKHNDPAYGWVQAADAKREGGSLYVKFSDINPDFEAGVASGAYRNRSVSVYNDKDAGWRLQHVGWLGAAPPAISGLAPLDYSAQVDAFEFGSAFTAQDWDMGAALDDTAELLRRLREQLIADKGLEVADTTLPHWRIQSIADTAGRVKAAALADGETTNPFTQHNTGASMHFTQEQLDAAAAQAAKDAEAAAAAKFQAQGLELTELRALRTLEQVNGTIQAATAAGKLPPALVPGLAEFMVSLEHAPQEFRFSAPTGGEVQKTPGQFFHEFLAALPVQVKLDERMANDAGSQLDKTSYSAIATAAQQFQAAEAKDGRSVSIEVAVAHVMATN